MGKWLYNKDNQLLKFGASLDKTSYTYTANGHVATETKNGVIRTYEYDAADRLVKVTQTIGGTETEIARYAYDPFGRRISKTVHGQTTYFIYSAEGLAAELNEGGDIEKAYGWELNSMYGTSPLWQAEVTNNKLNTAQFHTLIRDHLGTPQMAVNDQGVVTWKAVSESFGKTTLDTNNQITMNLRFPGQYFDEETNTHYNYFRDYNPNTGRYLQKDPFGLNAGINWYGYVENRPSVFMDPFGLLQRNPDGSFKFEIYAQGWLSSPDVKGYEHEIYLGYLFTDDGRKIEAYREIKPFSGTDKYDASEHSFTANCHGVTFANGQYWINNNQVMDILEGDGYYNDFEGDYIEGDVVLYVAADGEIVHTTTFMGYKDGIPQVRGKSGAESTIKTVRLGDSWSGKANTYIVRGRK